MFLTGRRTSELDEAVRVIGPDATAVPGDITNPADLDRLHEAVAARGRGLDVLFANAGTASFATIETITAQDVDQVFGVNVVGALLTVQKTLPLLDEGASVVINASTAAGHGTVGFGAHAAAAFKAGEGARIAIGRIGRTEEVAAPGGLPGRRGQQLRARSEPARRRRGEPDLSPRRCGRTSRRTRSVRVETVDAALR